MKRIANYLIALAVAAFTFTSCEDVPSPFGEIVKPDSGDDVIVIDPAGSGTEADPYNVTAIRERTTLLADGDVISGVYTKGYIVQIDEIDTSGTYGNSTYWISDDKEGKSGKFEVYRGVGLGGQKFNEAGATIIQEGDLVVIFGNTKNFKGNTPEYDSGSILVELNGEKASGGGGSTETLGTKDAPLTVAQALEYIKPLADNGTTDKDAYVAGKITQIKTSDENIAKYKNIDYVISDGTNEITVFRGKNLDNTDFTAAGQINVGDEVVVFGKLTKYVKDNTTTPEVAQGNYIVKYTKGSGGGTSGGAKGTGTQADPFNIAAAIAKCQEIGQTASTEKYYVKGIVVKGGKASGGYGNVTFTMGDTQDATDVFTAYQVAGTDGEKLADGYEVKTGDVVIVYGPIYNYKGNTPETSGKSAAQIVTINGKKTSESGTAAGDGSQSNPFNIAEAIAKCQEIGQTASTDKYYVKGIVVKGGKASGGYGNVTFTMGDTQDATDVFTAYQVAGTDGESLADGYEVKTGDVVIVYGPIYNYKGNTPETAGKSAAQIVTINGKKTSETGGGDTSGGGASASSITVDMSSLGVTNGNEMGTKTLSDGTELKFDKGSNSNAPKFYDSGKATRMYPTNTLTVTASQKIGSIQITCSANNAEGNVTASVGSVSVNDMNITISEINNTTITITNSHTGTGAVSQLRIATMVITYAN